jgi:HD-GYP domain-containing protein (c-di-GMP phosphodiesterase class II)
MINDESAFVDVSALRVGHFVVLDMGWLAHPFPSGSFKITSVKQIETIQGLGPKRVRIDHAKSDLSDPTPQPFETVQAADVVNAQPSQPDPEQQAALLEQQAQQRRSRALHDQQHSLVMCERRFTDSARQYRKTLEQLPTDPLLAAGIAQDLVQGFLKDILVQGDSAIRLLGHTSADKSTMHPVNVTVVSLLLGKAMGMERNALTELGLAAFLHDVGKTNLTERVRYLDESFSPGEVKQYQDHVAQGVILGRGMGLSKTVLLAISQHHELADGHGFPLGLKVETMSMSGRILALVNRFDNLCNPVRNGTVLTPHEALSLLFAQHKSRFDAAVLSAFIRMMGVYPPGSVVQLIDDRHALVVAVNSAKPLKPRVIVHEPGMARKEALILDLEHAPNTGIRRSLKPSSLPTAALDFLSPTQRVCYFFESLPEPKQEAAFA